MFGGTIKNWPTPFNKNGNPLLKWLLHSELLGDYWPYLIKCDDMISNKCDDKASHQTG